MPPSSGRRPTSGSGRPKLASSQATTRSQPSTISKPPPSAKPLTRAITGTSSVSRSAMPPKPPGRAPPSSRRPCADGFFMSAPAQKARSPAPVSTTTRTSRRCSSRPRCAAARPRWQVDRVHHLGPVDGDRATWSAPRRRSLIAAASRAQRAALRPALRRCARPAAAAPGAGRPRRPTCGSGWPMKRSGRPSRVAPSRIISLCSVCGSTSASRMSRTGAQSRSCASSRASQCSRVLLAKRSRKIACSSALC